MDFDILPMTEKHWDAVRQIYWEGIATGKATFEESVPEWAAMGRAPPANVQAGCVERRPRPRLGRAQPGFFAAGLPGRS